MTVAILIPCWNEERTIGKVVTDFRRELPDATVYVGDNNSTDATVAVAREAGALVIHVPQRGKGAVARAMFAGIDAGVYVMVDGDDTYPAPAVHKLIRPIRSGLADMTVGDRRTAGEYGRQNKRPFHNVGNALVTRSVNLLFRSQLTDIMSGYRALSQGFVKSLSIPGDGFELETQITLHALKSRVTILEFPIEYRDRPPDSPSKLRTVGDGIRVLRTIAGAVGTR